MHPVGGIEELSAELARRTRELEESERRFRAIIEHNADAILVVDRAGVIRYANPAARTMFARRRGSLAGTAFGFPLVVDETTELDLIGDGGVRAVEMRVVESEWEGSPARIASLRDITERKESEEQARRLIQEETAREAAEESARTLRFLADATSVLSASLDYATTLAALARLCVSEIADWSVVYAVDDAGHPWRLEIAHCEPSKQGLAEELQRIPISPTGLHPVLDVLRTRRPKVVHDVSGEALAEMTPDPREREIVRALGVSSFLIVPMVARDRPLGALALVRSTRGRRFTGDDVTLATDIAARAALAIDNARLYGEAQQANQSKTDFLAVVSHDLRTPLNAIIGYADLLDLGVPRPLPPESVQSVKRIRTSAHHLLYLLNELLAFARLDGGGERVHVERFDVRDVAGEVGAVMERLASERGLDFRIVVPADPVPAETDPDKLRQILLNLAGNAVKYTSRGSVTVDMSVEAAGETIVITIRDTGKGIAPADLKRIFEPFWQVDRTQRAHGGGTGLGLAVVKRMIELLGGDVQVQSEVGVGSTFTLRLPAGGRAPA